MMVSDERKKEGERERERKKEGDGEEDLTDKLLETNLYFRTFPLLL